MEADQKIGIADPRKIIVETNAKLDQAYGMRDAALNALEAYFPHRDESEYSEAAERYFRNSVSRRFECRKYQILMEHEKMLIDEMEG